jgi:hypothetical protein
MYAIHVTGTLLVTRVLSASWLLLRDLLLLPAAQHLAQLNSATVVVSWAIEFNFLIMSLSTQQQ